MSTLFDPANNARKAGAAVIDEPIINPPYDEPRYFWDTINWETHEQKPPEKKEGRRPAGYFYNPKGKAGTGSLLEEEFVGLRSVNEIRRRVKEWRERGYQGVTPVTRKLLEHWNREDCEPRLFFCQREAAETMVWLTESHPADRQGLITETVEGERVPLEQAHHPFVRYCCKMATGTGKTVVMAMIIAWQALNKKHYPQDARFTDAILIVGPGLTVKERLQVLYPKHEENYYKTFNLVPSSLGSDLAHGKICILHRQAMAIRDDSNTRGVEKLGPESDSAFANRLLKRELGSAGRILVLNDEGHHCYRPRLKSPEEKEEAATEEEKKENERAAQWLNGLEKIGRAREIMYCLDFSATPFYIHGSGYPVGRPFPWIVSDFGLLDAIESGLVKIPQMPIDDNHGDGKTPPAYFHLWKWVNDQLPAEARQTATRRAKPDAVVRAAEPAIVTMIGNWKKVFEEWEAKSSPVPPCMIIVSQDTGISELIFKRFTREDFEFDHFVNKDGKEVSYLFDSKALKAVEHAEEAENAKNREVRLREILNTVGKEKHHGEQVRFVSSVAMLTEGWDANNVTQIVGLRAFTSQLLCEQVVGRALRRRNYDVNPETGMLEPEYADIYGVPFQVIPVKASKAGGGGKPPASQLVIAMKQREAEHLISFPRVEGYVTDVRDRVKCDWESVQGIRVGKSGEPTWVEVGALAGLRIGRPDSLGVTKTEIQDRVPYYQVARLQPTLYRIAGDIVANYVPAGTENAERRRRELFPQVLEIVRRYVAECIVFEEAPKEEIGLLRWQDRIRNALLPHIHPVDAEGREIILPRIERFRPQGSTKEVRFPTGRPCYATKKSHISHVVLDSPLWEKVAAQQLETCDIVQSYARNDRLGFTIPYLDHTTGEPRSHRPDFIVRLTNGLLIALEIKGYVHELDEAKKAAGLKWAKAVNNHGEFGRWVYDVCYNPDDLCRQLQDLRS